MAHTTRWWGKTIREKKCKACGRTAICMEWKGEGLPKCGHDRVCEDKCYIILVKHAYQRHITRRQFLPELCVLISGLFIGGAIAAGVIYRLYTIKWIRLVTGREKKILINWALTKAENVSEQTICLLVETACESEFPPLIMAIIGAETSPKFDPGSKSRAGACGPMQVMPGVWLTTLIKKGIIKSKQDLFDPILGVRAGTFIFCQYLATARGDLKEATRLYLEGIHPKNKKEAEKYFNLIQKYLGQIYLEFHKAKEKQKKKEDKEEDNGTVS